MGDYDNLMTVSELSGLRNLIKDNCCTEQGIRYQIRMVESGQKKSEDVGFEVVRQTRTTVLVRLIDKRLEDFRQKLNAFVEAHTPKKVNDIPEI